MNIISKNSIYALPPKWITADSGDYFETRYVYFSNNPEEIYRIRFVGDSNDWNNSSVCTLGIIGEFDGNTWRNESALSNKEVERITKRFEEEILSKIKYSYVKSDNSTITDY
ncbi:MAG TPA: hypothetical protein VK559_10030 [Ferruginibacter sp.]|nr:hypothetical protein [Ferruginibacter sp.]